VRWAAGRAVRRPAGGPAQRRAWSRARSRAGWPARRPAGVPARHQTPCCRGRAWAVAPGGRERAAAGQRIQVAGPPCPGPSRAALSRLAWSRPGSRWPDPGLHRLRKGSRRPGWFRPGHCLPRGYRLGLPRPGSCHQGPRRRGWHRPARAAKGPARAGSAVSRRRCAPACGKARTNCLLAGVPAAQAHLSCPGPSLNVTVGAVATARRNFPPVTRHKART
jgi:hypothetical protein